MPPARVHDGRIGRSEQLHECAQDAASRRSTACKIAGAKNPISQSHARRSGLSSPSRKNIRLSFFQKFMHPHERPASMKRGGSRSSRNARRDAVAAMMPTDERLSSRTAKSGGPGAPMQASSRPRCLSIAPATVAIKLVHRGEPEVSRKPLRREGRSDYRLYLWSTRTSRIFSRGGPGAAATRPSLRPLISEGQGSTQNSGASAPRECARASARWLPTCAKPSLSHAQASPRHP